MNRSDFTKLVQMRLEEAKILYDQGKPSGAYYLAGYAVECALKACIAKRTRAEEFPPKPKLVGKYYTHDLVELLAAAELKGELEKQNTDEEFTENWTRITQWSEESRYELKDRIKAEELIKAIEDSSHGVLPWLQRYW